MGEISVTTLELVMANREKIRQIVKECFLSDPKLFGSVARGEDTEDSDIDILITPTEESTGWKLARAERQIEELLGKKVELTNSKTLIELFRPSIEQDLIDI